MLPHPIIIIGAGLSGLTLAHLLKKQKHSVLIIEARERIGGRIFSDTDESGNKIEMGATWLGIKHRNINQLLQKLDISIFPQELGNTAIYEPISTSPPQLVQLPPNNEPSYRISGGSENLIKHLAAGLDVSELHLDEKVVSISNADNSVKVGTDKNTYEGKVVITTLPPFLLTQSITFAPSLPHILLEKSKKTHTWMGESIKIGLRYKTPFWKKESTSGTIFSNVGPIPEMYDHSDEADKHYSLKGFLNGTYYSLTREERLEMVIRQLKRYYGEVAEDYISYAELVWRNEPFTYKDYGQHILPHENNGHPIFRELQYNGRLIISGSETAVQFAGYMDGAVESAFLAFQNIQNQQNIL